MDDDNKYVLIPEIANEETTQRTAEARIHEFKNTSFFQSQCESDHLSTHRH